MIRLRKNDWRVKTGMAKHRKHRKPTGELGSLRVSFGAATYFVAEVPETKDEIENWVLDRALSASSSRGSVLYQLMGAPVRNLENDFDFTLPTARGEEYLDLMEAVDLRRRAGYQNVPTSYNIAQMADAVFDKVMEKGRKYGTPARAIHLLLYSTDSRFFLRREVLDVIAFHASRYEHCFATIKYVYPDSNGTSLIDEVFPRPAAPVVTFDPGRAATTWTVFGDLRKATVEPDGSVTIPVQIPWSRR